MEDNRRVRRFFKCSKCKIFEDKLISPLTKYINCPYCSNHYKEISEDEYKQKKQMLKKRQKEEAEKKEGRRKRDNSFLHYSNLNINDNNINDNSNNNSNNHPNNINSNSNNINNNNHHHHNNHHNNQSNNNHNQNERNNENRHHHNERRRRQRSSNRARFNPHSNNNNFFNVIGNIMNPFQNFGIPNPIFRNPFRIVVQRQNVPNDIFDPMFSTFGSNFNGHFQDNFSSNFSSNFRGNFFNEIFRILEQNRAEQRRNPHPPTSEENLKKLKKFNMNEKYCKKDKDGKYELPNCCICLNEIQIGEKTMFLPCGHMFHCECSTTWLKKNNTCPICRFEIK